MGDNMSWERIYRLFENKKKDDLETYNSGLLNLLLCSGSIHSVKEFFSDDELKSRCDFDKIHNILTSFFCKCIQKDLEDFGEACRLMATVFALFEFDGIERGDFCGYRNSDEDNRKVVRDINELLPEEYRITEKLSEYPYRKGMHDFSYSWHGKLNKLWDEFRDYHNFLTREALEEIDKIKKDKKEAAKRRTREIIEKVKNPETCKLEEISRPGFPAKEIMRLFHVTTLREVLDLIEADEYKFFERLFRSKLKNVKSEDMERYVKGHGKYLKEKLESWGVDLKQGKNGVIEVEDLGNRDKLLLMVSKMSEKEAEKALILIGGEK